MKQNKTISIDVEIIEQLTKEKNGSGLINDLLKDYFSTGGALEKKEIETKIGLKELEIKKAQSILTSLKTKLDLINKREAELKKVYKHIPTEVLDDFKCFPKMTETILRTRYRDIYSRKYESLNWPQLKGAYDHYYQKEVKNGK